MRGREDETQRSPSQAAAATDPACAWPCDSPGICKATAAAHWLYHAGSSVCQGHCYTLQLPISEHTILADRLGRGQCPVQRKTWHTYVAAPPSTKFVLDRVPLATSPHTILAGSAKMVRFFTLNIFRNVLVGFENFWWKFLVGMHVMCSAMTGLLHV